MPPETPTPESAPVSAPAKPIRSWSDPKMIAAALAFLTTLTALMATYVQSRAAAQAGVMRADFGYNALRADSEQKSVQMTALVELVNELTRSVSAHEAVIRQLQVSSPATSATAAPPTIVMAPIGTPAPARSILRPLASSLPPAPAVQSPPRPPALPKSLDDLVGSQ